MNWLKKSIFFLAGCALVGATFFLEERLAGAQDALATASVFVAEKGADSAVASDNGRFAIESGSSARLVLTLSGNAALRFAPQSSAVLLLHEGDGSGRRGELEMKSGRVWVNTLSSSLDLAIRTPDIAVYLQPGIFDISYRDGMLRLAAHRRSADVEFLSRELFLPEGRSIELSEEKIRLRSDALDKLRYSKLAKEFPYFALEPPDEWALRNAKDDESFAAAWAKMRDESIRREGPNFASDEASFFSRLNELLQQGAVLLTFDAQRKQRRKSDLVFDYFEAAAYDLLIGNDGAAEKWLGLFRQQAATVRRAPSFQIQRARRSDRFAAASPFESFSALKLALREFSPEPVLGRLRLAFEDIQDAATGAHDEPAKTRVFAMLRRYGTLLEQTVKQVHGKDGRSGLLAQYVNFQDFLRRRPGFIRAEFMNIGRLYELAYLDLLETREEADDQRQFFIGEKLAQIETIRGLMNREVLGFQEGRGSILALAGQIEQIKPAFSDTAAASYFDRQLAQLGPLLAFLRSSRAEQLRGSFEEDLREFETHLRDLQKVTELLGSATGGTQISAFRREELAGIVASDFGGEGIGEIKLILPEGEDDPRVTIMSAKFEGKTFSGIYDTSRKVMSDLVFDGRRIPNAVRLENLSKFFLFQTGRLVLPAGVSPDSLTQAPSPQTLLERVSKATLIEQLAKLGIEAEDKYLGLEDLKQGVLHVRLATLGEDADTKVFSFDLAQNAGIVSQLKVQTVLGEIPVNDTFSLRELPVKVEQIFKRAVFEKQKEEELKKFTETGAVEGNE